MAEKLEGEVIVDRVRVPVNNLFVGGTAVTSTAAELNILDGATVVAGELNNLAGAFCGATISVGSEAANVINVAIQLDQTGGVALASRAACYAYLSDDANGDSVVATAHSSSPAIGTDGVLMPVVTDKCFMLVSESDGDIDIDFTEIGSKTVYLVLVMPNGSLVVSDAITHAA